jgi:hypothetical protein
VIIGTGVGLFLNQVSSASALTDQRLALAIGAGESCASTAPVHVAATTATIAARRMAFRSPCVDSMRTLGIAMPRCFRQPLQRIQERA